jgi:hypothetical protein
MPIIVSIDTSACPVDTRERLTLTYWTDRDPAHRQAETRANETVIPGQPDGTTVYWRVEPAPPEAPPSVYVVSTAHTSQLGAGGPAGRPALPACLEGRVKLNDVFYRREIHNMRRYTALAMDNIRREPVAFLLASAYRAVRLFVIRPASSGSATYKFAGAGLVYTGGLLLSVTYFLVFLAGVAIAWRQRSPLLAFLVPIVYVPATICFVLTNQRYSVTVQPLMFAFIALAIVTWWERRKVLGS